MDEKSDQFEVDQKIAPVELETQVSLVHESDQIDPIIKLSNESNRKNPDVPLNGDQQNDEEKDTGQKKPDKKEMTYDRGKQ